jgi:hypothetical protein
MPVLFTVAAVEMEVRTLPEAPRRAERAEKVDSENATLALT